MRVSLRVSAEQGPPRGHGMLPDFTQTSPITQVHLKHIQNIHYTPLPYINNIQLFLLFWGGVTSYLGLRPPRLHISSNVCPLHIHTHLQHLFTSTTRIQTPTATWGIITAYIPHNSHTTYLAYIFTPSSTLPTLYYPRHMCQSPSPTQQHVHNHYFNTTVHILQFLPFQPTPPSDCLSLYFHTTANPTQHHTTHKSTLPVGIYTYIYIYVYIYMYMYIYICIYIYIFG